VRDIRNRDRRSEIKKLERTASEGDLQKPRKTKLERKGIEALERKNPSFAKSAKDGPPSRIFV
jgi:hypothetical protein